MLNILIIDDETGIRKGLKHLFEREGYCVYDTDDYEYSLALINKISIQIAVIDIRIGSRNGIELLKEIRNIDQDIICLIITGYGSVSSAVNAMKEGASDYLMKPLDNEKLLQAIKYQLELKNLIVKNHYLKSELMEKVYSFEFITGNDRIREILATADKIKNTEATVMITGESGTGKEILSRYFHFTSNRKDAPFIGVNCAALSDTLLLSELFGHEKGAFTGAHERKRGKFELADNGTLFLDEIGDMSLETQAKLLRVLEERSFERVGGTKKIDVDIRLITATNKNLEELMAENKFRKDLYYRLAVFAYNLPPLRERPEDIPLLSNHFISVYNKKYMKQALPLSGELENQLLIRNWPGNVRELQNVINQGVLLNKGGVLNLGESFDPIKGEKTPDEENKSLQEQLAPVLNQWEEKILKETLTACKYRRTETAEKLGITRKTLSRKMEKYGL